MTCTSFSGPMSCACLRQCWQHVDRTVKNRVCFSDGADGPPFSGVASLERHRFFVRLRLPLRVGANGAGSEWTLARPSAPDRRPSPSIQVNPPVPFL